MVNHFRTLLLNELPSAESGEQYIDPLFRPITLTPEEALVRGLLIRDEYPRSYRNYIATLMTRMAYAGLHADLLEAQDPRVTIDFNDNQTPALLTRLQLFRDNAAAALQLVGVFTPDTDKGVFREDYQLLRLSGTSVQVTNVRTSGRRTVNLIFTSNSTDLYRLDPNRPLSFQFMGVDSVPAGFFARVTAETSMTYDVLAALARLKSNDRTANLFPLVTNGLVLRDDFYNAYQPQHALSAMLIAYALSVSRRL